MDTVVSYSSLNKTYILVTFIVIIAFAYAIVVLNSRFITEIASHGDCNDPWALYLNNGLRNKCVSSKQTDELKSHQQQFQRDATEITNNIAKIQTKIQTTDEEHAALQEYIRARNAEKWANVKQTVTNLSGTVESIKTKYNENADALKALINSYNTSIATNSELLVEVGNNLVAKLTRNIYTPKWSKQRAELVDSYNKIANYITQGNSVPGTTLATLSSDAINGKRQ